MTTIPEERRVRQEHATHLTKVVVNTSARICLPLLCSNGMSVGGRLVSDGMPVNVCLSVVVFIRFSFLVNFTRPTWESDVVPEI